MNKSYQVYERKGLFHIETIPVDMGSPSSICYCENKDAADGICAALNRDAEKFVKGPSKSPITVSVHLDESTGDWVLRLNTPMGFLSVGALNAEEEARAVEAVLQGALELECGVNNMNAMDGPATECPSIRGFWRGQDNANNIVEGRRIRELAAMIMDRDGVNAKLNRYGDE